jgi:VWFA-related protein
MRKMAALVAAGWATLLGIAQPPVFRVPVRVVEVPVVATGRDGSPVRNLQAAEFRLLDNGRPQKIKVGYADRPLSLAIVIQTNDAVRAWLPEVRRAKSSIEALLIGETGEASLTTFDDEVKVRQSMTADVSLLDKAFNSLALSGDKRLCLDAVNEAASQLEAVPPERRRIILIIGQPADVGSSTHLADILARTEKSNIAVYQLAMPLVGLDLMEKTIAVTKIHGVALGNGTGIMGSVDLTNLVPEIMRGEKTSSGQEDLVILTRELGGARIPFRKLRELESGIAAIGRELHTGYVLSYTPDTDTAGYHSIGVEVLQANVTVRARPGYYLH